jgi:alpha-1,2-mannosyltransferase
VFLSRPTALQARAGLVAANLAAVTVFLLSYSRHGVGFGPDHIDLDVYRIGARAWLDGQNLYGRLAATPAGIRLPFTYPPAAAVLLAPLALVPYPAAATLLTLGSIALLAMVLRVFLRRLGGPPAGSPWALAWLLAPALLLEPVRDTLAFGQVNILLMALVTADCLAETPRWPRGTLTGLAAAVKLTPAAFVLYFIARRDYRAAASAGLSFTAVTAAGFAADWHDSVRYWTRTVFQAGRAGNPAYASNQSILAVLARAGLNPHSPACVATWLALSGIVVIAACRGMRHALAAKQHCLALALNAFAALLISPVSWSHHWVWCAPALLTLASPGRRHRSRLPLAAAAGLAVFAAAPQFWLPYGMNREIRWAPWQQATGSCYVLYAALTLLLTATTRNPPGRAPATATSPRQPGPAHARRTARLPSPAATPAPHRPADLLPPAGVDTTTPEAAHAAREQGCVAALRRILGDLVETAGLARAAELLARASTSALTEGRVMYAGLRALPMPRSPWPGSGTRPTCCASTAGTATSLPWYASGSAGRRPTCSVPSPWASIRRSLSDGSTTSPRPAWPRSWTACAAAASSTPPAASPTPGVRPRPGSSQ